MSATEAKQRLVAIDVGEVSIVDHPANEEPFVVTKSKQPPTESTSMTTTATATEPTTKAGTDGGVMVPPLVAAQMTMNTLQDMLWRVMDKLRDPSKADEAKAELERIKAMLDKATEFTAMITKSAADITAEITKAKGSDKKAPAFMKESMQKLIDTLKAAMDDGPDSEPDGDPDDDKVAKAIEVVLKAGKKQFSKERVGKLVEAYKHMATMLKEADVEAFTKAMDEIVPQGKPATGNNGSAASGGGGTTGTNTDQPKAATPANGSVNKADDQQVAKSADQPPAWFTAGLENIKKSIDEVKTTTEAVSKRVEAVEKTEAVSKALGEDRQDKPGQNVKKSENIWKGLV